MATDIVQTLFGITPEGYQRQQAAAADQRALAIAQLNPMQRAEFNIGRSAYQLAGALGGTDPELARVSARQALAKQIDFNDPKSIQAGVRSLTEAGDTQGAMMLADTARKALESGALVSQRGAERMTPEQRNAMAYAAGLGFEPNSKEFRDAYLAKFEQLTSKDKDTKTPEQRNAEAFAATKGQPGTPAYAAAFQGKFEELIAKKPTANVKEVGVAEITRKPVYLDVNSNEQFVFGTDAQGKQVRQPYVGGVDRTTAKVSATNTQVQESEYAKKIGALYAGQVDNAINLRQNAAAAINTFNTLSDLSDQGLISGTFATGRVGATNLLNTLGLISGGDTEKLARSENYQKVAGDAILATLGGKLGAGFSNEDRKFIQGLVPQLENSPLARRQLIEFMQRKNRAIVDETTRLIDYAEANTGLKGFKPNIPLPGTTAPASGALQGLTDEELRRRYEAASKGKK